MPGEMADYILNGDDCQECGEYIGDGDGFPRTCAGCAKGFSGSLPIEPSKSGDTPPPLLACPADGCKRRFKTDEAYRQHFDAKH